MKSIRNNIFLFLIIYLLSPPVSYSQVSLSGTINSYSKIISVDNLDQITLNDASTFSVGDTVLIIQMKGVEISASNDLTFGIKQNALSAGWYEFLIIFDISGNQITFTADMFHNYDAGGHAQLIRVPGFDNVNVIGTLTCDPWDPLTGTGGVVAMIVGNTLQLMADIDVSANGFQGGSSVVRTSGTCSGVTDYFFNDASTEGGYKGEGAASYSFQSAQPLGTEYLKGRGAYFNGGGGGNGKYSGGGGGGNGGRGGAGGREEISCGFNLIGGINGFNIPDNIDYKNQKRIFMGAGGGAGTQLSGGNGTDGGNGGGIVIIVADTLVGNNNSIRANGETVTAIATGNGGGGGGGAGGTILLEVNSFKGSNLTVEANGGNGGTVSGVPTCTGPGGGGGGGIIWRSKSGAFPAEVSISVLPGAAIPGDCAAMLPAAGLPGVVTDNLIVPINGFLLNSIYSNKTGKTYTTICVDEDPPILLGTYPKGGTLPYTFVWESSEDETVWNLADGINDLMNYILGPIDDITYFRRIVIDNSAPQIIDVSKSIIVSVGSVITTGSITGNELVNESDVTPYTVDQSIGSIYNWTVSGGTILSGQGTDSINVQWGSPGSGAVSVIETNEEGCKGGTVNIEVNIGSTGIQSVLSEGLRIYPNPFNNKTIIEFKNPSSEPIRLTITDLSGKVVRIVENISSTSYELDREGLVQGFYFIELRGGTIYRGKILIE